MFEDSQYVPIPYFKKIIPETSILAEESHFFISLLNSLFESENRFISFKLKNFRF